MLPNNYLRCDCDVIHANAKYFHVNRREFLCGFCSRQYRAQTMVPVRISVAPVRCSINDCTRDAKVRSTNGAAYLCSEHMDLAPERMVRTLTEGPAVVTAVEVDLNGDEGWDILPLAHVACALGMAGCDVTRMSWVDDKPDLRKVLLFFEPGTPRPDVTGQIQALESGASKLDIKVKELTEQLKEVTGLKDTAVECFKTKNLRVAELEAEVAGLKESREQDRLHFQSLLADGRTEPEYMPVLDFSAGDRDL